MVDRGSQGRLGRNRHTLVGACLALGLAPAAPAYADFDDLFGFDQLFDAASLGAAVPDVAAATDTLDLSQVVGDDIYTWASVVEVVFAGLFQNQLYATVHDLGEMWIQGPGVLLDPIINPLFAFDGACGLICNGVNGTVDHPDGGDGGWLFGDGAAATTRAPPKTPNSASTAGPVATRR